MKSFLDNPTATHLMFIDADIGFEPEAVARLLAFDQDVVAGMYPIKVVDWARMASVLASGHDGGDGARGFDALRGRPCTGDEREERGGFVTGAYAGTGFMMIAAKSSSGSSST